MTKLILSDSKSRGSVHITSVPVVSRTSITVRLPPDDWAENGGCVPRLRIGGNGSPRWIVIGLLQVAQ